jgi:uncharacterized NAD(P)/FAD-binding protein YdhS
MKAIIVPIHNYKGLNYVIIDEVDDPKDFSKWLNNQTAPDIPDVEAAYLWDYERYLDQKRGKTIR